MAPRLRVSVILPCFNAEAFVADAIASVAAQTRPPDEIIVVDDGSTDASLRAIKGAGQRVRILEQANRGVAAARNAGIAASSGDVLAFLDADDAWPPDSLELRLAEMERTGADLVAGRVRQCADGVGLNVPSAGVELVGRLAGAILIRRSAFARVGDFDERLRSAETIDWIARAREVGLREAHCDRLVLFRRVHGTNMMRDHAAGERGQLSVLRAALARRRQLAQ